MKALNAAVYRVRQVLWAARATWRPLDLSVLDEHLNQEQRVLFLQMSRPDQRHSLAVFRQLRSAGRDDPELLRAALLHDVGKTGAGVCLWHRVIIVLARAFCPSLLARLAQEHPGSWQHPFYLYLQHAPLGAARARLVGVSPEIEMLIREHHNLASSVLKGALAENLRALQQADSAN
jgi:hypothetical protein